MVGFGRDMSYAAKLVETERNLRSRRAFEPHRFSAIAGREMAGGPVCEARTRCGWDGQADIKALDNLLIPWYHKAATLWR